MVNSTFLSREPVTVASELIGRADVLAWIANRLGQYHPENINLVGEPKIGKTSVLTHVISQRLGAVEPTIYVWVDLMTLPVCNSDTFWPFLLAQLVTAVEEAQIPLPVFDEEEEIPERVNGVLEHLRLHAQPVRLLLVIDAFDRLAAEMTIHDLHWLRAMLIEHAARLGFVIGGLSSLGDLLEHLEREERGSLFSELFHTWHLGLLEQEDATLLCQKAAAGNGRPLPTPADIQFLLAEAGCHPALLKIACHYLFLAQAADSDHPYEDAAADLRLDTAVKNLCLRLWRRRTLAEQQALKALAAGAVTVEDRLVRRQLEGKLALVTNKDGRLSLFAGVFADCVCVKEIPSAAAVAVGETAVVDNAPPTEPVFEHIPKQRLVRKDGVEIALTPLENRLLAYLRDHQDEVCTYEALLRDVWGPGKSEHVVEKGINRLRQKIEEDASRPRYILSMRGEGYRWQGDG